MLDRLLARAGRVPRGLLALGRRALERLALDVRGRRLRRGEDALHLRRGLGRERGRSACGELPLPLLESVGQIPQVGVHGRGVITAAAHRKVTPFDPLAVEVHDGHPRRCHSRTAPARARPLSARSGAAPPGSVKGPGRDGRGPCPSLAFAAYSWTSASTVLEVFVTGSPWPSGGVPVTVAEFV